MPKSPRSAARRPAFHFTPARFWMNDPNGPVYVDGEYHLFFQYNPQASDWGRISWGHAISRDLVRWTELEPALSADDDMIIYSGSSVVDIGNTSGLGTDGAIPIVAVYTAHTTTAAGARQSQHLAWSTDRGRSWRHYANNPVLDIGSSAFRDPKVFWHDGTSRWIMAVVLAEEHEVLFYASTDLRSWEFLSSFGPLGSAEGEWECPDVFCLPMEGRPDERRWILKVDDTLGGQAGGSGGQYFVGDFDGTRFRVDEAAGDARPLDYGADFYAATTWSNLPADGRRLWLGWMSNWRYARTTPTAPFRGVQSLPRSLHLVSVRGVPSLVQRPVEELQTLRTRQRCWKELRLGADESLTLDDSDVDALELDLCLAARSDTKLALHLPHADDGVTTIGIDSAAGELSVDRRRTSIKQFHTAYPACHRAPLHAADGTIEVRVLLDHCCLEVFANDGETVISDLVFSDADPCCIRIDCGEGAAEIRRLDLWRLEP